MTLAYSVRLWPNGELTAGVVPKTAINPYSNHVPPTTEADRWAVECVRQHGAAETWDHIGDGAPLGSSQLSKNHTRERRGLKGIPSKGARMVRNAAHVLEQRHGRWRLAMLTCTLPELSETDRVNVHANWAAILRVFTQWMKRRLDKSIDTGYLVGVTEIQEKRYARSKQVWNHIHIVYPARLKHPTDWLITAGEFRNAWERAVSQFCTGRYDFKASIDCAAIRKSASGYIGKYCTKGKAFVQQSIGEASQKDLPRSWYFVSNGLRKEVYRAIRGRGFDGHSLIKHGPAARAWGVLSYYKEITLDRGHPSGDFPDGYSMIIGCTARVNPAIMDVFIRTKGDLQKCMEIYAKQS